MSTILFLEIVMANLLNFAENKKLPSADGTDGSDGVMEIRQLIKQFPLSRRT